MLPKKFPEYSILHDILLKKIKKLEETKENTPEKINYIQTKIQKYQRELYKIEKMFPEKFFDKN